MVRIFFAASLLVTFWALLMLWPYENTLTLAAEGKINFNAAWGYRFRAADLLSASDKAPVLLQIFRPFGPKFFCMFLVLLQLPAMLRKVPRVLYMAAFGAALVSAFLFFTLANPWRLVERQRVMGGAALSDEIASRKTGEKVAVTEDCLAAINPPDLRMISSLELLDKASVRSFSRILLIDLKVVEENYRLLTIKDEKGRPLFSDAARAFAAAEIAYAKKNLNDLLVEKKLCLIANFDSAPQNESAPFSRARRLIDVRKKAGLDTRVIHLPAGFTRR